MRHSRDDPEQPDNRRGKPPCPGKGDELRDDLAAEIVSGRYPTDDDAGGRGYDEGRNLGYQPVADGQQRVGLAGLDQAQMVLPYADDQTADQVDEQDQDGRDRIAADEFAGAVHGAEKIGLARDLLAPPHRLFLIDQTGVEIGIDRHLLAGHSVECKARGDLGDAPGAFGDDHEIDDDQDREYGDADGVIAADDEQAERFNDPARGVRSPIALQQDDAGGCDIERQAQQRGQQKQGRKGREVRRFGRVQRGQQDHQGEADVESEENVQYERRQRQHHHRQDQDERDRSGQR